MVHPFVQRFQLQKSALVLTGERSTKAAVTGGGASCRAEPERQDGEALQEALEAGGGVLPLLHLGAVAAGLGGEAKAVRDRVARLRQRRRARELVEAVVDFGGGEARGLGCVDIEHEFAFRSL